MKLVKNNKKEDEMMNFYDQELMTKACQSAGFLVRDLYGIVRSSNLLLAENSIDFLQQAAKLEKKLKRLGFMMQQDDVKRGDGEENAKNRANSMDSEQN